MDDNLGERSMTILSRLFATALLYAYAAPSFSDAIHVEALADGHHPDSLGGYTMTPFNEPTGTANCTPSPSGGEVCFKDYWGNDVALPAESPWWWQYDGSPAPNHGNVFVVRQHNWIDLILPANTRAFSLFVGASDQGRAWIQAFDDQNNSTERVRFSVADGDTRGYGVYTTGCSSLTRITVEPFEWGFGYLSSYQGQCHPVPEPGAASLLLVGLLGLVMFRMSVTRPETA